MRKILILFALLTPLATAQVDTKDGTAITAGNTFDGETGLDTVDGQAIKAAAGGPTVDEDFTSCASITDITNTITCSSGLAGGGSNYANNYGYHTTVLATANHYAEIDGDWDGYGAHAVPIVRCDGNGASATGYTVGLNNSGSNLAIELKSFSGATLTYRGDCSLTGQNLTGGTRVKMRLSVNSSNQFSFWIDVDDDGTYQADEKANTCATDATYTGDQYVGVTVFRSTSDSKIDWLQGDDE